MPDITLEELKTNMDDWVKEMNSNVVKLKEVPSIMVENTDNIQHNYELLAEMRTEITELKQEIKLLKLMQLVALKEKKVKA